MNKIIEEVKTLISRQVLNNIYMSKPIMEFHSANIKSFIFLLMKILKGI